MSVDTVLCAIYPRPFREVVGVSSLVACFSSAVAAAQKVKPSHVAEEVITALNIDKMIPSYKSVVTIR